MKTSPQKATIDEATKQVKKCHFFGVSPMGELQFLSAHLAAARLMAVVTVCRWEEEWNMGKQTPQRLINRPSDCSKFFNFHSSENLL